MNDKQDKKYRYRIVKIKQGYAGFVASSRGLCRVYLRAPASAALRREIKLDADAAVEDRSLLQGLASDLERYYAGKRVRFNVRIDISETTDFDAEVYRACRSIPYGQTRSYKQLAEQVGRPGAARAVGGAMRRNPCPIITPCHRVLRSDGALGGFSSPGGVADKLKLLNMESAS